ncbi:hypothetical protein F5B22DRAFT_621302 [Xylaria bambusicola]|uniref:uncharacterized protein n=1 Tax=Xylaria bambusicola TaxID=326684 RepID=UPI002007D722|nr:uncharacterized protein F5B22DRAFT_621302 [Xylaria bambusicola]KAI0508420.1 hypothetical protein F5B22DRAFT_621302 [Xylaria bambusicola]
MDAGNREDEDRCLGATLPTRNFGAPSSTPRRPLRYHHQRPHQHYYPFGQKHENGHDHTHDHTNAHAHAHDHAHSRDFLPQQIFFPDPHPQSPGTAAVGAPSATSLTATATSITLDDSLLESHAAHNQDAIHANAAASIESNGLFNPDDFYRIHLDGLMASTLPPPRHSRDAPLRSNGSGPASRPVRPGVRPSVRSVSAPVEEGVSTSTGRSRPAAPNTWNNRSLHKPSVKDLTKKFDQGATHTTTSTPRKTTPRIPSRETSRSGSNGQPSYATGRSSASGSSVGTSTSTSPARRPTQRRRTGPDNNPSSSSQSFANRIAKPRSTVSASSQASKSMTNLAPVPSSDSVPALPQSRSLLFGEVKPAELHAGLAGHGIDGIPAAKASASNANSALGRRQRSFSHTDAEPSSPSDWYRSVAGDPGGTGAVDADVIHNAPKHVRSRSELGFTNPVQQQSKATRSSRPKPTLDTSVSPSTSRIPVSVRKYSTPSSSSSPNSTRSNSPSTVRKPFPHGKKINATQNQGAKTPSPLATPAIKRQNRPGAISANGSTRLNAYISAPLPKLSPPLRSSRPRQPVSSASTISSRVKAIERDKSPSKRDPKANAKGNEPATRRRKISLGPIDYESRREQIKLSYTKSLRENEARAVSRKAAQEKKRKAEEEARALAAAEALKHEEEVQIKLVEPDEIIAATKPVGVRTITPELIIEKTGTAEADTSGLPPLQTVMTKVGVNEVPISSANTGCEMDSAMLGMPGSFPGAEVTGDDEAPPSAVSNTTEFDAEPQTDPPVQEFPMVNTEGPGGINGYHQTISQKSEYRSPFDDEPAADDDLSIKIALDTSTELLTTPGDVSEPNGGVNSSQGASTTDQEAYEAKPLHSPFYETKVTILGGDADFPPPTIETASAPEQQDAESSNEQDHVYIGSITIPDTNLTQTTAEQTEPSSGLSEIAEFFVGPTINHQGQLQSFTDSKVYGDAEVDKMTSVQQESDNPVYSLDSESTLATYTSLTVPRTSESINRASQTSVWTDFSMNSQDSSSGYNPIDHDSQRVAFTWREELADSETESRSESYRFNHTSMAIMRSRDVSPRGTYQEPDVYESQHQLPEIDTGEEFGAAILSSKNSMGSAAIPVLPSHAPPPPPSDDASFHDVMTSAPPSEYYDDTRPNSYVDNEKDDQRLVLVDSLKRDSDCFAPTDSASRSIDQGSFTTSEDHEPQFNSSQLTSQQTLVESINVEQTIDLPAKERKRLFTRLETIKELIDTETFFIRDMNIVEEIYKGTAEACPKLDDKTIKLIFRNTDKIIQFHSAFLVELKEGVSSVYVPRTHRHVHKDAVGSGDGPTLTRAPTAASAQVNDDKDRETLLGPIFTRNIENMKQVHETFLKNSDHASKQLIQIQEDPTVQVWLNECNEVARELTRAWNLDSLLIKPMQRITKYPNLLIQLLHETPADHPDRTSLEAAKVAVENAIEEINKTKKNFELVGQIVSRRRKESDVKVGFARAFGKRVDRLQPASNKPSEDAEYLKLHEKFGDDYLRLQVVLRDVEFYTRQVTEHVHEFLQYLSSMELVMRIQPSPHPEIESKWVRFNVSMRDLEKIALEQHLSQVRKQVIEPFELVIKSYSNPSLAMKKRSKRRVDYEKFVQLQKSGKKVDKQLSDLVEQYEALNEALKKELPKLSSLTEKVGNICLGNFVNIQAQWYSIWKEKVKMVLEDTNSIPEFSDIVSTFFQDYKFQDEQINAIGIINPASKGRPSHSTSVDEVSSRFRLRPAERSPRHRGLSLNSDIAPSLPTPDFVKRHSGQFAASPSIPSTSSPNQYYRDYYTGVNGHTRPPSDSPKAPEFPLISRSIGTPPARPGTSQSHDSNGLVRQSAESNSQGRGYSNSAQPSPYQGSESHRFSGLFQSALPMSDTQEPHLRRSQVSSRASSRERQPINGYNVLWLAASLFEFNIHTTKHEAGYPYLTYQAGEIFDVIAEKGELWLAKNQDDPNNLVGWLWSKHFAKLADD